jgi:hypothetical protein
MMYLQSMFVESVSKLTARMKRLEALAFPRDHDAAFFNAQIEIANLHGMTYREGLEFVIRMRYGGAH